MATAVREVSRTLWTWRWWTALALSVVCLVVGTGLYLARDTPPLEAEAPESRPVAPSSGAAHVPVTYPHKGGVERATTQPGSVQAFESVDLYAGVSGYLKTQGVDIGDHVKKGQVLATVDVPDLEQQVKRDLAAVDQADARVKQMNARVLSARADLVAANATVVEAQANHKSKKASRRFREQQLKRMQDLLTLRSIDERLVDEKTEERDAAVEAENAAEAAIATANAQVAASRARIDRAEADVREAEAEVKVAQANLDKTRVMVKYATIVSPFDGVITRRNFFPSDYIDAANTGSTHLPLLNVQRTDLFRVVVQVPDRDAPFVHPGNAATVEFDALGDKKFPAEVSRISQSEDPETRLMHVEIDLHNPTGEIGNGMYGKATIALDKADALNIPSSCLVGKSQKGRGSVYVVRDGRAHLTPVLVGSDNGIEATILGGLKPQDEVVTDVGAGLEDGAPVVPTPQANATTGR